MYFPFFKPQPGAWGQKIRRSAADDLFRVSLEIGVAVCAGAQVRRIQTTTLQRIPPEQEITHSPMKNCRLSCPGHPASKRIVRFQTPMLIQIHILSNSRPWVWGLLSFGGDGELLSAYITTRTVRRKARTFRYMV